MCSLVRLCSTRFEGKPEHFGLLLALANGNEASVQKDVKRIYSSMQQNTVPSTKAQSDSRTMSTRQTQLTTGTESLGPKHNRGETTDG